VARRDGNEEMVDVRRAALLLGRHPETVRRWVWSGRLPARRHGNRLLLRRADIEALAESQGIGTLTLAEWAEQARAVREAPGRDSGVSLSDLVLEDRRARSR
jgi:excisionase family DNA binding protein